MDKLTHDSSTDYPDDGECWNCAGEGVTYHCIDGQCEDADIGCDLCERRCDVCAPAKDAP